MRIPLSWLREFIPLSLTADEIARTLTQLGLEVEHVEKIGENLKQIVVAAVLESNRHPNADKLSVATVTDGERTYQIVCGAPNCRKGIKVALARVGTTLQEDGENYTIKKAKIRGVESEGMLCSESEIGLSHALFDGILELPEDLPFHTSLYDLLADTYFDIALTPNLGHCMSVYGVARELSAALSLPLQLPQFDIHEGNYALSSALELHVQEKKDCPRYACRMIRGVKVAPSPLWLQQRLEKCGLRSVNNVVDVTNFVMFELGHPLHAFDFAKIASEELTVRRAKSGETIVGIDGKERVLTDEMLIIADLSHPLAIAGVMGGANSEISSETVDVVLESAYFDPMSIRKTSKKLGIQTESSKRFERGCDPNAVLLALDRAAALIQEVAGGEILSGKYDRRAAEFHEVEVPCRLSRIDRIIGHAVSRGEVEDIFNRLHFAYVWDGQDRFSVRVPTYRNDVRAEIDLIEEVARLYGYDNIPRQGGKYLASTLPSSPIYLFEQTISSLLIAEGLTQFLTCDLIGPTLLGIAQPKKEMQEVMVRVANPTSVEQSILRTSLLPSLLQVIKTNFDRGNRSLAGFEVGQIHFCNNDTFVEQSVAGIVLYGQATSPHWGEKGREVDFFDLKGIVENLFSALGIKDYSFKNIGLGSFHAGKQASVFVGSLEVGSFGEIHPAIQRKLDVPGRIFFGEFLLQELMRQAKPKEKIEALSLYPCSERDWTVTVKQSISFENMMQIIRQVKSPLVEEVSLKDIYCSDKLPPGCHNLTFHFVYRNNEKTIEQETVDAEHRRITEAVEQKIRN